MEIEDIVRFIYRCYAVGISDEDIDKELLNKGVTQEELDTANDIYCQRYSSKCQQPE